MLSQPLLRTLPSTSLPIRTAAALLRTRQFSSTMSSRNRKGDDNPIHRAAENIGEMKDSNPKKPSVMSSGGAIGRQFNPDGALGSIPQAVGGPLEKDGVIGSQFDAAKHGVAGTVEKMVDGPSQAPKGTKLPDGPSKG